jgi:hypothetical protein
MKRVDDRYARRVNVPLRCKNGRCWNFDEYRRQMRFRSDKWGVNSRNDASNGNKNPDHRFISNGAS